VARVRKLTRAEAIERTRLIDVRSYDITVDLTDGSGKPGEGTFRTVTAIVFNCAEPGAGTFIEVAAHAVRSAVLNGGPVDLSAWSAESGLVLTGLAAENILVVDADFDFDFATSGEGLHRAVDPVDKEVYLYSQFEPQNAQKVYACFDQPDPSQLALTQPYVSKCFQTAAKVWAEQDSAPAREFIMVGYPRFHITPAAISLADDWLAQTGHPAPLRRLVTEARDAAVRSLTARRHDAAASG
jgi:hypothetical protein